MAKAVKLLSKETTDDAWVESIPDVVISLCDTFDIEDPEFLVKEAFRRGLQSIEALEQFLKLHMYVYSDDEIKAAADRAFAYWLELDKKKAQAKIPPGGPCTSGTAQNLFFPLKPSLDPDDAGYCSSVNEFRKKMAEFLMDVAMARRMCSGCPRNIREDCLSYSVTFSQREDNDRVGIEEGVWGGMGENARWLVAGQFNRLRREWIEANFF